MTEEQALAALRAARNPSSHESWETAKHFLTAPGFGRGVRQAAMRGLGVGVFMSRIPFDDSGPRKAAELVALLTPFLADPDPTNRLAAARELGSAKIPASIAALEARKKVEQDARVLTEIDGALREIARKDFEPGGR